MARGLSEKLYPQKSEKLATKSVRLFVVNRLCGKEALVDKGVFYKQLENMAKIAYETLLGQDVHDLLIISIVTSQGTIELYQLSQRQRSMMHFADDTYNAVVLHLGQLVVSWQVAFDVGSLNVWSAYAEHVETAVYGCPYVLMVSIDK